MRWENEEGQYGKADKKGFFEKFLNVLGIEAEEVVEDDDAAAAEEEPVRRKEPKERGKLLSIANSNKTVKMIVIEPKGFEEVQTIVDHLKNKRAVIINLEETEKTTARRIADFLGGAIYALEGTMQKISGSIFLFTPAHMEVSVPLRTELKEKDRGSAPPVFTSNMFRNDRDR